MKNNNNSEIKVLVTGRFNVLHPGYQRLLGFAKEVGSILIVGIEGDKLIGETSQVSEKTRLDGVRNLAMVNEAFIFNESIEEVIRNCKPDIVVKGKEHETKVNPEEKVLAEMGGKIIFSSGEMFFSLTDFTDEETRRLKFQIPNNYIDRHNINNQKLHSIVEKFQKLKICVIGDIIIDEYILCEPLGMSQEDPTIVVTPRENKMFLGGAGIVASHAVGLGADVEFISTIGHDETGLFTKNTLKDYGVKNKLFLDESRPTTLKQRFRCKEKTMLRVSHLNQAAISTKLQGKIFNFLDERMKKYDLLVFSDFNYGCLPQELVDKIVKSAIKNNVFLAADSQSSSQIGDISRFKNMDLITPTEREARISARDTNSGLVVLCDELCNNSFAKNMILKLGENGVLIHKNQRKKNEIFTDRIFSLNPLPKDIAGAGDSLLISSAMALSVGANIWESAYLGSLSAGIQISRLGNVPLNLQELSMAIDR